MLRNFLEGHFNEIGSVGIGLRQYREGLMGSLVVDVTLVSKFSKDSSFNKITFGMNYSYFFETDVHILPAPEWTYCSSIPGQNECIRLRDYPDTGIMLCGWCSLIMSCMQGVY
jgi:hypothetical protein